MPRYCRGHSRDVSPSAVEMCDRRRDTGCFSPPEQLGRLCSWWSRNVGEPPDVWRRVAGWDAGSPNKGPRWGCRASNLRLVLDVYDWMLMGEWYVPRELSRHCRSDVRGLLSWAVQQGLFRKRHVRSSGSINYVVQYQRVEEQERGA